MKVISTKMLENEFRLLCAKEQAMEDMAKGTAKAELLETLPVTEALGFDFREFAS